MCPSQAWAFFYHWFFIMLSCMCAEGLAFMISAGAGTPQEAAAIGPAPLVLSMLFGGFFISASRIPPALRWIR